MKNSNLVRLKNFPEINNHSMLVVDNANYSIKDQIFFTRIDHNTIREIPLFEPTSEIDDNTRKNIHVHMGPNIDLKSKMLKTSAMTSQEIKSILGNTIEDYLKSLVVHISLAACYFIVSYFFTLNYSKPQIIEVAFGLTDKITQTSHVKDPNKSIGETEATRTLQDLPQLTKNSAPDTAPKVAQNDQLSLNTKANNLLPSEKNKLTQPEQKQKQENVSKIEGPKFDSTLKKLNEEDFLKRKEEDLRKIAEKRNEGVHGKNKLKPEGQTKAIRDLPKSPFQTSDEVPAAPAGLAPAGEEKGTNVTNYNTYKTYLKNQLRLNWNINEGRSSYQSNIQTIISIIINPFGYLVGHPIIKKSSGSAEFDGLALQAVLSTFPVGTPPPKSINPPVTFEVTYKPKGLD
jgi:hypothetical protein